MTDIHMVFCKNLAALRKKNGFTQEEMAEKLKSGVRYYQQLEYGFKTKTQWPSPTKIRQLARILKCETTDLFKPVKKT